MTPARMEPATFRFAAQHLNHFATARGLPLLNNYFCEMIKWKQDNNMACHWRFFFIIYEYMCNEMGYIVLPENVWILFIGEYFI